MFAKNLLGLALRLGLGFILVLAACNGVMAQESDPVSFEQHIKPILENHCINCHGPELEEGTRLDIREDALDYIEPGDAENSPLYEYLISDDEEELMPPPDENNPLSAEQISLVRRWIDEGAQWPEGMQLVDLQVAQDAVPPATDVQPVPSTTDGQPVPVPAEAKDETLWNAIGSLHPAAIHFPIGLLIAAGLFALFSIRGNFVMSDCAYYCLWLGTLGAIVACLSGWWFCALENRDTVSQWQDLLDQDHDIFWHRTSALVFTGFAILLCLFAAGARSRDPDDGVLWKLGLMVLAAGIAWTGHEGGKLTHGKDLYEDLNKLIQSILPMDELGLTPDEPIIDPVEESDQTGATSEEIQ